MTGYKEIWDRRAMSPYLIGGQKQWLGFENERSIAEKTRHARQLNVGGVMIFALFHDDRHGKCGNGTYPLVKTAKRIMMP